MIDFTNNIIESKTDSYSDFSNNHDDFTSISIPPGRTKNNILHIAGAGATMLLGSQFSYSNPIIHFNYQTDNIETVVTEYANNIELPSTYYFTEINNILRINYTKKEIIKEILSFKSLTNNWDGYGSIPLEIEASSNTLYLIDELDNNAIVSLTDIIPNSNGTVTLAWENENDEILSLEIGNNTMSYFFSLLSCEIIYSNNVTINEKNINKILELVNKL